MSPRLQIRLSTILLFVALALLAFMVTTEGEPGALPLALLVAGGVGLATGIVRAKGVKRTQGAAPP